jgi:hypothetical protein
MDILLDGTAVAIDDHVRHATCGSAGRPVAVRHAKVWYKKDQKDMTITIYAEPSSSFEIQNSKLEVSYRLSAPRFDSAKWPNTSDADVEGMNLDKLIK